MKSLVVGCSFAVVVRSGGFRSSCVWPYNLVLGLRLVEAVVVMYHCLMCLLVQRGMVGWARRRVGGREGRRWMWFVLWLRGRGRVLCVWAVVGVRFVVLLPLQGGRRVCSPGRDVRRLWTPGRVWSLWRCGGGWGRRGGWGWVASLVVIVEVDSWGLRVERDCSAL